MRVYLKIITAAIIAAAMFQDLYAARTGGTSTVRPASDIQVPAIPSTPKPETKELHFMNDLEMAMVKAKTEYRPIFLLFSSTECQWCIKLKEEILKRPEIIKLLEHFILVDIDVELDNSNKWNYMVQGVPTIIFLSSEGNIRNRIDGFMDDPETLKKILIACSGNSDAVTKDVDFEKAVKMLESGKIPDDKWPEIMILLGKGMNERKELIRLIFKMNEKPVNQFVKMLSDKRLAVRLGALEILEELSGDDFSFDPWVSSGDVASKNLKAIEKWNEWAGNRKSDDGKIFSALTGERCSILLGEVINSPAERAMRAARAIEAGGSGMVPVIRKFLEENPALPEGSRQKILQVLYTVILSGKNGEDAGTLSHKLLFGNIDTRLKAIRGLSKFKMTALPVLADFIVSSDPMVREAAADAIAETGLRAGIKILGRQLEVEKNREVIFAILSGLGKIRSIYSGAVLIKVLPTLTDEDLVIAALNSLGSTKSYGIENVLEKSLKDERWRVRAAALECAEKSGSATLGPKVEVLLDDKDQFIRSKAVSVISKITKRSSGAAAKLASIYFKDDSMKAPILKALCSMDIKINKNFLDALDNKDSQTLISIAGIISESGKNIEPVAKKLVTYDNPDISYPAITFIAGHCMNQKEEVDLIANILAGNDKGKISAVFSELDFKNDNTLFARYLCLKKSERYGRNSYFEDVVEEAPKKEASKGKDSADEILSAFEEPEKKAEKPKETATVNNSNPDADDIFNAFETPEKKQQELAKKEESKPVIKNPQEKLLYQIKRLFKESDNEETKTTCAKLLLMTGSKEALDYITKHFSSMPGETKSEVLRKLSDLDTTKFDFQKIVNIALSDTDAEVRSDAIRCVFETCNMDYLKIVFEQLDSKKPLYTAYNIMKEHYSLQESMEKKSLKKFFREWVVKTLSSESSPDMSKILALVILSSFWEKDDTKLISNSFKSPNKWVRREAFELLSQKDERTFVKMLPEILGDDSEYVRILVPEGYLAKMDMSSDRTVYFGDNEIEEYYERRSNFNYNEVVHMPKKIQKALESLMEDPVPRVRLEAFFAMLTYKKPINANNLSGTLAIFPDQEAIAKRISDIMEHDYSKMGKEASVLLPYLEKSRDLEEKEIKKIYAHFNKEYESQDIDKDIYVARSEKNVKDEALKNGAGNGKDAFFKTVATEKVKMVYFSKQGCKDCEKARRMLNDLKQLFPEMEIEEYDIGMVKSMKLNEAYCERFNVPENIRLVAPAVFAQGGYLIKGSIGFDNLGKLVTESFRKRGKDWYIIMPDEMESSGNRISERYGKFSLAFIMGAGLLDGINPCAFATIIFFISYLTIARRDPKEIFYVGASFIAGVFIAYLSLGFGFLEIVGRISAMKSIGKYFNYAVALIAFAIMIFSIYDGVMCMRGKMEKMSLQLPDFLKERIRSSIRVSMKMRHFVIAAFVTGIIVSFLELACTGQVYAPTILFMLKSGGDQIGAINKLFLYNFAFIIPLCVVFCFAYFGVKSETFITLMKKHTAFVKFATALLFMSLFILLLIF